MPCRVCKSTLIVSGLLNYCQNIDCKAVHWDKTAIKKLIKIEPDLKAEKHTPTLDVILSQAKVPSWKPNEHYVYTIRLRGALRKGTIGKLYVGMTGLHPHARYLNHVRGYKAASSVRKFGTAMISFEGPMLHDDAIKREGALAEELRLKNYEVCGGH